jgi:hypothetical protein
MTTSFAAPVRTTLLAAALVLLLALAGPARAADPNSVRVAPVKDNSVAQPRHAHRYKGRFVRSRRLEVGGPKKLVAVLRFRLNPLPDRGTHAVLRLYVRSKVRKGLVVRRAQRHGARFRFSRASVKTGRIHHKGWVSIDVTGLVTSRDVVTLAVSSRSRRPVVIASREAKHKRPGLVLRRPGGGASVPAGVPVVGVPAPPAAATKTVMAVGDTCSSGGSPECVQVAQVIRDQHPDAFLHLGDMQYQDGNQSAFDAGYGHIFSDLHAITYPVFGETHDFGWTGYPVSFMNQHSAVAGKLSDAQWGYSFDLGAWHVVALDYGHPNVAALQADLNAHPSQCLLAVDHAPIIGTPTSTHSSDQGSMFLPTLKAHGVDLIVNGHNHVYERGSDGTLTWLQVGTGGIGHYSFTSPVPGSAVRSTTAYGAVKLVLSPTGWTSQYVNAPGSSLVDAAAGGCGP